MRYLIKYITFGLCVFLFLLLWSCGEVVREKSRVSADRLLSLFERIDSLFAEEVTLSSPLDSIGDIGALLVSDSILIVSPNTPPYLHLFDLSSGDLIVQSGLQGKGPGELVDFGNFISRSPIPGYIDVFQGNSQRHFQLELSTGILSEVGRLSGMCMNMIYLEDSVYFSFVSDSSKRYALSDGHGVIHQTFLDYPLSENIRSSDAGLFLAYQGRIEKHPEKNLFFTTTTFAPQFEICQMEKDGLIRLFELYLDFPRITDQSYEGSYSVSFLPECMVSTIDMCSTGEYIYILWSGREYKEDYDVKYNSQTVLVFDWEGNPVRKMELSQPVQYITVTEDDQTLFAFAVDPTNFEERILKFGL